MIVYPMDIQIYDQVSILRSTSKVNLHLYNFVKVWLKGAKNNYEHCESWHAHLSSKCASNFNSDKFVKSETPSCGFAKVGVKGGENSSKHHKIWTARLSIKWASKSMIKFQLQENCQK